MRELFDGAGELTREQEARSWSSVRTLIENGDRSRAVKPRRKRIVVIGSFVAAIAVAGSTAAAVAFWPVTDRSIAQCRSYTSDGRSIEGTDVGIASAADDSGGDNPAYVDDAVGLCGSLWRDGLLRRDHSGIAQPPAGAKEAVHPGAPFPVPPLVGCVNDDGIAVVVVGTGPQSCLDAGLGSPPPE